MRNAKLFEWYVRFVSMQTKRTFRRAFSAISLSLLVELCPIKYVHLTDSQDMAADILHKAHSIILLHRISFFFIAKICTFSFSSLLFCVAVFSFFFVNERYCWRDKAFVLSKIICKFLFFSHSDGKSEERIGVCAVHVWVWSR